MLAILTTVWSVLTSKLAGPIAAGIAAIFLVLFLWTWAEDGFKLHELRSELTAAQMDAGTARTNQAVAQAAVVAANQSTIKLQQEAQARTANATAAIVGLQTQLRSALAKEQAIAKRPSPASPAAACGDLNDLFLESVQ